MSTLLGPDFLRRLSSTHNDTDISGVISWGVGQQAEAERNIKILLQHIHTSVKPYHQTFSWHLGLCLMCMTLLFHPNIFILFCFCVFCICRLIETLSTHPLAMNVAEDLLLCFNMGSSGHYLEFLQGGCQEKLWSSVHDWEQLDVPSLRSSCSHFIYVLWVHLQMLN